MCGTLRLRVGLDLFHQLGHLHAKLLGLTSQVGKTSVNLAHARDDFSACHAAPPSFGNDVRVRLKAPPSFGRGRCSMVAGLIQVRLSGMVVQRVSQPGCFGLRTVTRNPLLMARSLTLSSSRSLLAMTTMLFLLWQSRKITSVLGAVCPAVFCEFCISIAFKFGQQKSGRRYAAIEMTSTTRGLFLT